MKPNEAASRSHGYKLFFPQGVNDKPFNYNIFDMSRDPTEKTNLANVIARHASSGIHMNGAQSMNMTELATFARMSRQSKAHLHRVALFLHKAAASFVTNVR